MFSRLLAKLLVSCRAVFGDGLKGHAEFSAGTIRGERYR